jgi:hypothetical protein
MKKNKFKDQDIQKFYDIFKKENDHNIKCMMEFNKNLVKISSKLLKDLKKT